MDEFRVQAQIDAKRGLWTCELWSGVHHEDGTQKWKLQARWTFHDLRHKMTESEMIWCVLAKIAR